MTETTEMTKARRSPGLVLARKLSGVEADMVASRVELAQRLRDAARRPERAGLRREGRWRLRHLDIVAGGELVFEMAATPGRVQ